MFFFQGKEGTYFLWKIYVYVVDYHHPMVKGEPKKPQSKNFIDFFVTKIYHLRVYQPMID
jgi:hypothetical protein